VLYSRCGGGVVMQHCERPLGSWDQGLHSPQEHIGPHGRALMPTASGLRLSTFITLGFPSDSPTPPLPFSSPAKCRESYGTTCREISPRQCYQPAASPAEATDTECPNVGLWGMWLGVVRLTGFCHNLIGDTGV